jgi:serine/threonine-protein kinase
MLVGRRPDGTSPDWTALPAATPSNTRRVLRLCLQIHPANRLRDIGDARILLEETPDTPVARPDAAWRRWLPWAISAALASVLVAGALRIQRKAPDAAVARFTVAMPSGSLNADLAVQNVPSPDGASIAMVVFDPKLGKQLIWLRDLRSLGFRELEQTEGANYPFWSPDGASIGFFAGGNLKKVSVATGAFKTLCDAGGPETAPLGPERNDRVQLQSRPPDAGVFGRRSGYSRDFHR